MSIQHDHTLNPVTALEFYFTASGPLILAGEGCYLKVFEPVTFNLLSQFKVFDGQAIHGIAARHNESLPDDDGDMEVVIWGGSSLSVFSRKTLTKLLRGSSRPEISNGSNSSSECATCTVSDWILDVATSPQRSHECVLVTAHNTVLRAKVGKDSDEISIETLHSPSRSILYSAHLTWESESNVLVAAGTVFGEIIVWQCSFSIDGVSSGSRVLHTFTGHEGSIFGVNISSVFADRDGHPRRLLASCSDDRTIRIWELNLGQEVDGGLPKALAARETGFGGNEDQGETSSKCLAMAMGHASRIWSAQFLVGDSSISVLSFGEDATTQHWALEDSKLTHLDTFAYHTGKQIWSRALRPGERTIVVTGGADGKISLFEIPTPASKDGIGPSSTEQLHNGSILEAAMQSQSWDLEEILGGLPSASLAESQLESNRRFAHQSFNSTEGSKNPINLLPVVEKQLPGIAQNYFPDTAPAEGKPAKKPKPKKAPKDVMNRYAFVSENQVLMTSTFGRVLLGEIGTCISWREVNMPDSGRTDLKSYSIVQSISAIGVAFLGSASGKIFMYRNGTVHEFAKVSGKIADMFTIYHETKVDLLVTTLGARIATLFECGEEPSLGSGLFKPNERSLTLPERLVITSAGKINGVFILGSRNGGLAIYDPEKSDEPICTWTPSDTYPGDAITSVINVPSSVNDSNYILTTCRDGTYSIFRLTNTNPKIALVHQGTPPFGPMIEAAWFSGSDLILYGFKSKNFIVWNETRQYEISSIECGGAHRSYAYSPREDSDGAGYFIYTKASKLYLHSQTKPSHQIIKAGGHGREIKACAVSDGGLIATGAEDTAIRIWKYGNQFDCLAAVQKHTTGIQHLQWHSSKYLLSSGGNEEFFIWAVESIPGFGIGVVCESTCPDQSEEKDLRIMSFDVSESEGPTSSTNDSKLVISLAYSDSTIRVYTYSKSEKFHLVAKGRYTSSCLMQLRHLEICIDALVLLTAATDGNLTVWKTALKKDYNRSSGDCGSGADCSKKMEESSLDLSNRLSDSRLVDPLKEESDSALRLVSSHRVHQSSVKSLDIARNERGIVIATGGDDNAFAITFYEDLDKTPKSVILRSAHAAAITGLSFVSRSEGEEWRIVTSGNDQRVKEWELRLDTGAPAFKKIGDIFTSIADVGDLTTLKDSAKGDARRALVVGNGMEVYEVSRVDS